MKLIRFREMRVKFSPSFLPETRMPGALVLAALCIVAGCGSDKEAIIREKVEERVTAFRAKENAKCREALPIS